MTDRARLVRASELRVPASGPTPGMRRREAFADETVWVGTVHTDAGVLTGWHHHPTYDTYVYIVEGSGRLEYGPGGSVVLEGGAGDFMFIPAGSIHREGSAAGSKGVDAVLVRVGSGEIVVNVDGPAAR